jgi:hypothetical protein
MEIGFATKTLGFTVLLAELGVNVNVIQKPLP